MWTVESKYRSKEDYGIANWPGRALGPHWREFTDFVQESMFQSREDSRRFGWDDINLWHGNCDVMIVNYTIWSAGKTVSYSIFYAVFSIYNYIITWNERIAHVNVQKIFHWSLNCNICMNIVSLDCPFNLWGES